MILIILVCLIYILLCWEGVSSIYSIDRYVKKKNWNFIRDDLSVVQFPFSIFLFQMVYKCKYGRLFTEYFQVCCYHSQKLFNLPDTKPNDVLRVFRNSILTPKMLIKLPRDYSEFIRQASQYEYVNIALLSFALSVSNQFIFMLIVDMIRILCP